jgi:hypothetical protein
MRAMFSTMTAARKLEPLAFLENDPVLAAFLNAPVSDEPETDEERAAFELGMADIRAGRVRTVGREEIQATIERMRRDQGE